MRTWVSRVVVVIAVLASIATSPKRWKLTAAPGAGMPRESPDGLSGLLVTVESSDTPEVRCEFANGQWSRSVPGQQGTHLCPPGGKLASVELSGRVKMGLCGGDDGPPKSAYVRVVKSELVPVWRATVEDVFDVSSDVGIAVRVESPRTSFVDAVVEGSNDTAGISVSSYADNFHRIYVDGGTGSERRTARVRVRATVFDVCAKDCAKPADEPLKLVRAE